MQTNSSPSAVQIEAEKFLLDLGQTKDSDFKTSDMYHLFPDAQSDPESAWPKPWPGAEYAGVYFIFDGDQKLNYIGKSSMGSSHGARLSKHFFYEDALSKICSFKPGWERR